MRTGTEVLAFPDVSFEDLITLIPELVAVDDVVRRQVERDALYAHYITRQQREIAALKKDEDYRIPQSFDFSSIDGLSNELKQKLSDTRPPTLAHAARIDGMTPAALALILVRLRRLDRVKRA